MRAHERRRGAQPRRGSGAPRQPRRFGRHPGRLRSSLRGRHLLVSAGSGSGRRHPDDDLVGRLERLAAGPGQRGPAEDQRQDGSTLCRPVPSDRAARDVRPGELRPLAIRPSWTSAAAAEAHQPLLGRGMGDDHPREQLDPVRFGRVESRRLRLTGAEARAGWTAVRTQSPGCGERRCRTASPSVAAWIVPSAMRTRPMTEAPRAPGGEPAVICRIAVAAMALAPRGGRRRRAAPRVFRWPLRSARTRRARRRGGVRARSSLRATRPGPDEAEVPPPLRQSAFTYDNALAAIALAACGDVARARRIGDALLHALGHDRTFHGWPDAQRLPRRPGGRRAAGPAGLVGGRAEALGRGCLSGRHRHRERRLGGAGAAHPRCRGRAAAGYLRGAARDCSAGSSAHARDRRAPGRVLRRGRRLRSARRRRSPGNRPSTISTSHAVAAWLAPPRRPARGRALAAKRARLPRCGVRRRSRRLFRLGTEPDGTLQPTDQWRSTRSSGRSSASPTHRPPGAAR